MFGVLPRHEILATSRVVVSSERAAVTVPGDGVATLYGVGLDPNETSAVGSLAPTMDAGGSPLA